MAKLHLGLLVLFSALSAVWSAPANCEETGVFSLTANRQYSDSIPPEEHPRDGDLAFREFVRQGLLLSAREEFGLATRDETLLETVDRESPETFDVVVTAKSYHGLNFQVSRGGEQLLDLYIRDMLENAKSYQVIAAEVEKHTRGEFAKMLEEAGYPRQPDDWHASAELPAGADALLQEMNDISQFRALRSIHQSIRESGESPERLGGLVRGYSNLSQLTIRGIDCRGFAFRCRAWLYAERLRQKTNGSPFADWHWAYMAVMVGQPTPAQEAIARAQAAADGSQPEWGNLIKQYCEYRYEDLANCALQTKDDPYSELATVLFVRAVQQLNSKIAVLEGGRDALERLPDCLWIQEQMYPAAGVSYKHMLIGMGPELLSDELKKRLPEVAELPPEVDRLVLQHDRLDQLAIGRIASAVVAAGADDCDEPSLQVLGRNIEAFNLLHIFRTADVYKQALSSDAEGYVDDVAAAAQNHPLAPLLETYRFSKSHRMDAFAPLMKDFAFKDGNPFTGYQFYNSLPPNLPLANMIASEARDLCWYGQMEDEEYIAADVYRSDSIHPTTLENMQFISSESPMRLGAQLRYNYDSVKDNEQEWLEKYGHYPSIHSALGVVYLEKGEYRKATEHLKIATKTFGDFQDLNNLASAYYKLGDDHWLSAIERVLDREDYALEHAKANAIIAHTLMGQGKFEAALPYAEESAQSGALWAYEVRLDCLTGLQRWDEAEETARIAGQRYRKSTWFDWCAETGKGDLEAAWAAEQQRLERFAPVGDRTIDVQQVLYLLVTEQRQQALDFVSEKLDDEFTPWNCMHQALLADELGDVSKRDQALADMAAYEPRDDAHWNPYKYLAVVMQQALKENRSITMGDIEAIFADRKDFETWVFPLQYWAATFNRLHCEGDERTAMMKAAACRGGLGAWARTLAWSRLRLDGIDPVQLENRHYSMAYTKPRE